MRIGLIANSENRDAMAAAQTLLPMLRQRRECHVAELISEASEPALREWRPDLLIALGGDGTILRTARFIVGLTVPVAGINFGKLGYLAAFSMDQFQEHLELILAGRAPITERLMLHGAIGPADGRAAAPRSAALPEQPLFECVALNDIVLNAGWPFRMVELTVQINAQDTTTFRGDGLIVSTSSGSTGYNLSAGGPLISPDVNAMVITPICAHSLSFRPVVVPDQAVIGLQPRRVNAGTTVSFDGQVVQPLREHQCVLVRRAAKPLRLVENPALSHWRLLADKLAWARSPQA